MLNTGMRWSDLAQCPLSQAGLPLHGRIGLEEARDLQRAGMAVDEFEIAGLALTPGSRSPQLGRRLG
jgi:hypothetical protein